MEGQGYTGETKAQLCCQLKHWEIMLTWKQAL